MARKKYLNGDSITLGNCNGCNPATIQGVICHEHGCPDAWRDKTVECRECGSDFLREDRHQIFCDDCLNPPDEYECEEEE